MTPRANTHSVGTWAAVFALHWLLIACGSLEPEVSELPPAKIATSGRVRRSDEPFKSVEQTHYADGEQIRSHRELLILPNGKIMQHGRQAAWFSDGQLEYERFFEEDQATGVWKTWFRNGAQRSEVYCSQTGSGTTRWWYESGQVSSEGLSMKGQKNGPWTHFYPNGSRSAKGAYQVGRKHGEWEMWDEDGNPSSRGRFDRGVRVGRWKIWSESGESHSRGSEEAP